MLHILHHQTQLLQSLFWLCPEQQLTPHHPVSGSTGESCAETLPSCQCDQIRRSLLALCCPVRTHSFHWPSCSQVAVDTALAEANLTQVPEHKVNGIWTSLHKTQWTWDNGTRLSRYQPPKTVTSARLQLLRSKCAKLSVSIFAVWTMFFLKVRCSTRRSGRVRNHPALRVSLSK